MHLYYQGQRRKKEKTPCILDSMQHFVSVSLNLGDYSKLLAPRRKGKGTESFSLPSQMSKLSYLKLTDFVNITI